MANRRKQCLVTTSAAILLALNMAALVQADEQDAVLDHGAAERLFTLRVLPLLKVKCFGCHGEDPTDIRGDLDVRFPQSRLPGGRNPLALAGIVWCRAETTPTLMRGGDRQ